MGEPYHTYDSDALYSDTYGKSEETGKEDGPMWYYVELSTEA